MTTQRQIDRVLDAQFRGLDIVRAANLPYPPSDGERARRIVRHGMKDILAWLNQSPGAAPDEETHCFVAGGKIFVSADLEKMLRDSLGPRYPDVHVQLSGNSSNAFAIMGAVTRALRAAGVSSAECDEFRREAMSGTYDELLQTCMRWVEVS